MAKRRKPDPDDAAKRALEHGDEFPYDDGRKGGWEYRAARGVLVDLTDRRGIKHGFNDIDLETKCEIVDALAGIIRQAHKQAAES